MGFYSKAMRYLQIYGYENIAYPLCHSKLPESPSVYCLNELQMVV